MHQQVADRHLARDVRIRHLKPRQVVDDRRVPPDLAFLDEHAERNRGEDLGVGRDAEERPAVDRVPDRPASARRSPSRRTTFPSLTTASGDRPAPRTCVMTRAT